MGEGEAEGAAAAHQCGWAWLCYDTYEQVARLAGYHPWHAARLAGYHPLRGDLWLALTARGPVVHAP